jgi:hypothetical protein
LSTIDEYDLNIRSWSARAFVWTAKLWWPLALAFAAVEGLLEWLLEWFDVAVIGFRFAFKLRPWPKAVYWIVWEFTALTFLLGLVTGLVGHELVPGTFLGATVWALLLMPPAYFVVRVALLLVIRWTHRGDDRTRRLRRRV